MDYKVVNGMPRWEQILRLEAKWWMCTLQESVEKTTEIALMS